MATGITYSMCWEDPRLVLKALAISANDRVLSIASGGENVFALLLKHPKTIVAIDSNPFQLNLVRLKSVAIQHLDYTDFCKFMGVLACKDRFVYFSRLRPFLSSAEVSFWNRHQREINRGILRLGKFEKYLGLFRTLVLHAVLSKDEINNYLSMDSVTEQRDFFFRTWNSPLWKLLFSVFFSKPVMLLGRKRSSFTHNPIKNVALHYYERAKKGIITTPARSNFFMHLILTGTLPTPFSGHPYFDKNNFMKLKGLVGRIRYVNDNFEHFLVCQPNVFTKYNLSDLFETCSQQDYERVLSLLVKNSPLGSRVCYWNNLVPRARHSSVRGLKKLEALSKQLAGSDRVFFYSDFIVETVV